ncbi:hypothetical protein OIDMADRAFT_107716 [Oidiodendron maius Zn]|uniref:Apple domain-containing protein n=1 Tax=Oidiodendron maius (strain Zn) TaxID=913774 RepID=A0A0C3DYJ6_OIDMZ|nr:hypothetical protein OIDMADRAFT_107716 [Oidiodendron maius Zn]
MQFLTLAVLAALSSQFTSVLSLPVSEFSELEQRDNPAPGAGTLASPRVLTIDCTSVAEVCNAQCAAILCFGAPSVMKYSAGKASCTAQRTAGGAGSSPFKAPLAKLVGGGTVTTPNPSWVSPEDTTNACAAEGGFGVLISPVDAARNSGSVQDGQYFTKSYTGTASAPYCAALMKKPADQSVCKASQGTTDPKDFMFRRTTQKQGNSILWQKVVYGKHTYSTDETKWGLP